MESTDSVIRHSFLNIFYETAAPCSPSEALKGKNAMNRTKAEKLKEALAEKYAKRRVEMEERARRREDLEERMKTLNLEEAQKDIYREELGKFEISVRRENMKRYTVEDFSSLKLIGRGASGEVRLVRKNDTREVWALKSITKEISKHKNQSLYVQTERDILALIDNDWIVRLQFSFQDELRLYMVMEYLPGGDLMGLLIKEDTFSEGATRHFMAEIVQALSCVHSMGYVHRDLKPDNILIDRYGHLKLSDLGLSKKISFDSDYIGIENGEDNGNNTSVDPEFRQISDDQFETEGYEWKTKRKGCRELAYSAVGTPDYIAPEVLSRRGYGPECDWWSLGIIMFECLIGYTPFHGKDAVITCRKIARWNQYLRIPSRCKLDLSSDCMDFMLRLICNADLRLGKNSISEIRTHAWFNNLNWDTLRNVQAPYIPQRADDFGQLFQNVQNLEIDDPELVNCVNELTGSFDTIEEKEGNIWGGPKKLGRRDKNHDFIGYTYVRKQGGVKKENINLAASFGLLEILQGETVPVNSGL